MQKIDSVVAVIGAGSMGGAIASGLVASGAADASRVLVSDPSAEKRAELEKSSIRTFADTADMLAENPDVVILAVKPQILPGVVRDAADHLGSAAVISIAAGVSLATLESLLPDTRVVRVMPNLPVQVLSGATAVCRGSRSTDADVELACAIFGALGCAKVMREDQLDAEGAVVSCGPAYIALMVDAMTRSGVEKGLPAADCREMVLTTMRGVCQQMLDSGEHPRAYMERVTSPGGTTAAGLRELEPNLVFGVEEAVDAALARTEELSRAK